MHKINARCVDELTDGGVDEEFAEDLPEPVRVVSEAALRNAVLVLDALAATLRSVATGPVNKAGATADQIRIIIDAVEAGRRLDTTCCANPWRGVLARHLLP
ncbi:hypothetical protein [Streptoalloteichus hindustanus]|uniref:Uncharacterized protein n=1 Tax=Streptoalloteichus hindustanus TaxID=2017 RepID=A0A1M4TN46_STRHI|nr:hypothetical protein [Streptoalloteichus hindustanus]SHE45825.1 hypothetical protein SAMN05444320_101143 [Streptoalloteichus hindustanus]